MIDWSLFAFWAGAFLGAVLLAELSSAMGERLTAAVSARLARRRRPELRAAEAVQRLAWLASGRHGEGAERAVAAAERAAVLGVLGAPPQADAARLHLDAATLAVLVEIVAADPRIASVRVAETGAGWEFARLYRRLRALNG